MPSLRATSARSIWMTGLTTPRCDLSVSVCAVAAVASRARRLSRIGSNERPDYRAAPCDHFVAHRPMLYPPGCPVRNANAAAGVIYRARLRASEPDRALQVL